MIFFGWYKDEFYSTRPKDLKCTNCNAVSQTIVKGWVSGWNILFIPVFPYKVRHELECVSCKRIIEFRDMDTESKNKYAPYKAKKIPPFWHFSGLLMIGVFLIWSKVLVYQERTKLQTRIEEIRIGRIIELKTQESEYTTMKVYVVNDESISVGYNLYQVDKESGLSKIHQTKNYSKDTLTMDRSILNDWLEEDKIIAIF